MQVWNVLRAARWKCRTQKIAKNLPSGHHRRTLSGYTFTIKARINNWKKACQTAMSPPHVHNMVNFGLLAVEIRCRVWGTPANFSRICVLAALLHDTLVVDVSQTLCHWTVGATYIWQGGHHIGHWPTFLVLDLDYVTLLLVADLQQRKVSHANQLTRADRRLVLLLSSFTWVIHAVR